MSTCRTCGFTHPESDCPRWPAREQATRPAAATRSAWERGPDAYRSAPRLASPGRTTRVPLDVVARPERKERTTRS